jgi:bifunctional DNase/RNase
MYKHKTTNVFFTYNGEYKKFSDMDNTPSDAVILINNTTKNPMVISKSLLNKYFVELV